MILIVLYSHYNGTAGPIYLFLLFYHILVYFKKIYYLKMTSINKNVKQQIDSTKYIGYDEVFCPFCSYQINATSIQRHFKRFLSIFITF